MLFFMNWEFQLRFYTEVPGTEPAHPDAGRPRAACTGDQETLQLRSEAILKAKLLRAAATELPLRYDTKLLQTNSYPENAYSYMRSVKIDTCPGRT